MLGRALMTAAILVAASVTNPLASGFDPSEAPSVVELVAQDVVILEAPDDRGARVLLTFPDLDQSSRRTVVSARLLLPHLEASEDLTLEVRTLIRPWSPSTVSWTFPWNRPGGDYNEQGREISRLAAGRDSTRPVAFNVTRQVRAISEEEHPNYGFLLKISNALGIVEGALEVPTEVLEGLSLGSPVRLVIVCAATE